MLVTRVKLTRAKKIITYLFSIYFLCLLSFSYFPYGHNCNSCSSNNVCSLSEKPNNKNENIIEPHSCFLCIIISIANNTLSTDSIYFDSNQNSKPTQAYPDYFILLQKKYNKLKERAPPLSS